jgi:hypothetical protein
MKRNLILVLLLLSATSLSAQTITTQPASQTVQNGQTATFTASVSGGPCRIRWNIGSTTVWQATASTASYTTPPTTSAMSGESLVVEFFACAGGPLSVISTRATLTVITPIVLGSLSIVPATPTVAIGKTQQFILTGTYSDGSSKDLSSSATWTSSDPTIATVSSGVATGVAVGSTTIAASFGGFSASMLLTVDLANVVLTINPASTATFDDGTPLLLASVNVQQQSNEGRPGRWMKKSSTTFAKTSPCSRPNASSPKRLLRSRPRRSITHKPSQMSGGERCRMSSISARRATRLTHC